jgi:aspartyl-tRNA(Asn)/glutamyl-tRNA(Gln) amidotransferase subunit A
MSATPSRSHEPAHEPARPFDGYEVEACRRRIAERNDVLNAVLHVVDPAPAPARGAKSPIAGVPYVLKDTWDTAGIPTTGGSWRHRDRVPEESSHAHLALERAGAVLLGKSNLCDLAFSTESDNHLRGPVRNPHDLARTAGGSTGGGAAAVADGMAAFDWGSDFGGSIRGPAAFCGVVGLRLSATVWPVERHHFPRLSPFFWDMCGMGPIARDVASARAVVDALRADLRRDVPAPSIDPNVVVLWAPDEAHRAEWPTFVEDAQRLLDRTGVGWVVSRDLPTPSEINVLYTEYLAAHFDELVATGELPLLEGIPAVLLGVASWGRLDRRVHPNTALLLAAVAGLHLVYRDKARAVDKVQSVRERVRAIWRSGALVVSPTTTVRPPRHGRAALVHRAMSFCKLGNLVDATGLAVPCGTFPVSPKIPALPRSLQILGPPGSEDAVLDLGARLERAPSGVFA